MRHMNEEKMFVNILIISYLFMINDVASAEESNCSYLPYPVRNWTFEEHLPPPAQLTPSLTEAGLNLSVSSKREEFNLTLLANPFIEDQSECPPLNTSDYNLRRYSWLCSLFTNDEVTNVTFYQIFTGCYYFVMVNRQQQHWYAKHFYKTSYKYLDTRVTYIDPEISKPESLYSNMQLQVILEIPLDCIAVSVKLFERPHDANNAISEIKKEKHLEDQSCIVEIDGTSRSVKCKRDGKITAGISSEVHKKGDKWITQLTWANLTRGGGHYYLLYSNVDLRECEEEYHTDFRTWKLIKEETYVDLKERYGLDIPKPSPPSEGFPWLWVACGLVGFIFIIIVFCGIWMWLSGPCRKKNESDGTPLLLKVPRRLIDGSQPAKILLIYEQGCPSSEELQAFKRRLKQNCRDCDIRDAYATSEWTDLETLGTRKWVQQQFEAGCIVIWFDTPQLRSRLIDHEESRTTADFRDLAAPYALSLTKNNLFRNGPTEYSGHIVVQMEAFRVEDPQGGPLELVTPQTRYLLPGHFPDLLEKINSLTERRSNNGNLRTELELVSPSNSGTGSRVSQQNNHELA